MPSEKCFREGCDKPGNFKCSACLVARYCGRDCQKLDRRTHKADCVTSANCFIIRAAPKSATTPPLDNVAAQLEPLNLTSIGNEAAEKAELAKALGWTSGVSEVGKFYDDKGTDTWYYYIYGAANAYTNKKSKLPRNDVGSLVTYEKVFGDIAVVRSGPLGNDFNVTITSTELAAAVEFHKTHDRGEVFTEREYSRMMGNMKLNTTGNSGMYMNFTGGGGIGIKKL